MDSIKCVVVGDSSAGKTSLLTAYTTKSPAPAQVPVLLADGAATVTLDRPDGKQYVLGLWDTTAEQGYTRLTPVWYPQTDVFLVCFAINSYVSFDNVVERWIPRARHIVPHARCLVVGTKTDLRGCDGGSRAAGLVTGKQVRKRVMSRGLEYVECSARTLDNVEAVFERAVSLALSPPVPVTKKSRCLIL
ncbi:Rho family protein [Aspergillus lucknowensis]|uniref:Rac-like GTP-binding protein 5 n=1 Tax=Aspergillus lucknowensis TaxID=176173 RepID=A0ABR4LQ04_9EURO